MATEQNNTISTASLENIEDILIQIQSMAITIKTLSHAALEGCGMDKAGAAAAHAIGILASRTGYLSDEGLGKLNKPHNDAGFWFLPPVLQDNESEVHHG